VSQHLQQQDADAQVGSPQGHPRLAQISDHPWVEPAPVKRTLLFSRPLESDKPVLSPYIVLLWAGLRFEKPATKNSSNQPPQGSESGGLNIGPLQACQHSSHERSWEMYPRSLFLKCRPQSPPSSDQPTFCTLPELQSAPLPINSQCQGVRHYVTYLFNIYLRCCESPNRQGSATFSVNTCILCGHG
jgi:hypothetical protein